MGDTVNVTIEGNMLIQRSPGDNASGQHNDVIQSFHGGGSGAGNPSGWIMRYNWIELNMGSFRTGDNSWNMLEDFDDGTAGFACKIYGNVFIGDGTANSGNNGMGCALNAGSHLYIYNNTFIVKNGPDSTVASWAYALSSPGILFMRNNAGQATSQVGNFFKLQGESNAQNTVAVGAQWNRNFWSNTGSGKTIYAGPNGLMNSTLPLFVDYANNNFAPAATLKNAGDSSIGAEFNQGPCPGATWPNPTLCTRSALNWDVGAFQSSGVSGSGPGAPSGLAALVQ
jgi:hypothetical protein